VIGLGVRLAVAGGRQAIARLLMIAAAVAVGSCLLLATLSALHALDAQNDRLAWLETGFVNPSGQADGAADGLWWLLRGDEFDGRLFAHVDVAATGPNAPIPPGVAALPGPGELLVSPALAELMERTPAAQLAERYPGEVVGTIGRDALASPDSLVVIAGHEPAELAAEPDAVLVTEISTTGPDECGSSCAPFVGTSTAGMTLILGSVAGALLFPLLVFIAGATRLSAARREQRFAAMRLVGATPRQIAVVAAVEAAIAAVTGVVVGFGLFGALRPLLAQLPFAEEPLFTGDLTLTARDVLLVGIGIPIAATIAAGVALRRVVVSPLGVTRQAPRRAVHASRLVPLAAGIVWLGYLAWFSDIGASRNTGTQALAYLAGIFSIMIGLVVAGPWLTSIVARLTAGRATRPAGLIAARRLADDPRTAFRAISGVVLGTFVFGCALGVITSVVAHHGGSADTSAEDRGTLMSSELDLYAGDSAVTFDEDDRTLLLAVDGVEGVTVLYQDPASDQPGPPTNGAQVVPEGPPSDPPRQPSGPQFVARCDQLATTPALGRCPAGAGAARVELRLGGAIIEDEAPMTSTTWPGADLTAEQLDSLPVVTVAVATDGSAASVERARTVLQRVLPGRIAPQTLAEIRALSVRDIDQLRHLVDVVLLASLCIAGCSLAVNVAGGLADRRRPFSMLRLTGVKPSTLRRVVAVEAVVPLLSGVVIATGAGLATAALFLRAQTSYGLQAPGRQFYALLAAGFLTSLAVIASTLPLLARTTGPEAARLT
jgi:FtsX-like permease family